VRHAWKWPVPVPNTSEADIGRRHPDSKRGLIITISDKNTSLIKERCSYVVLTLLLSKLNSFRVQVITEI
jgi:hypothetical protein